MVYTCCRCKTPKDESEFAVCKSHKRGRTYYCKKCGAASVRDYYDRNTVKLLARARRWQKKNKRYFSERIRIKRETDDNLKILGSLRRRINELARKKAGRTIQLVGCSVEFLRGYLEARFKPGMSWENYGQWQIDHRIPCAEFDLRDPDQQRQCFHYSNLQPLWKRENQSKGAKMPATHQAELI